ncbi:MAG: SDR family oxidoreductase [Bdellovibrionaceae bacterium]|nr:SDR family oxidoreductase [Bdellovibrio sp.]
MSKTALVTGASSGIGRAIAIRLAREDYKIIVHYNSNLKGAEKTLSEVSKISKHAHHLLQFDSSNYEQVETALKDIEVDVLINNAGFHKDAPALLMDNASFQKVIETNLYGAFYLSKLCGKKMLLKRAGSIVNIASLAGQTGNPGQANYAASKAGLIALTKTMAMELGSRGIRVNAVAPGFIETEMITEVPGLEAMKKRIPLGRFGTANEVAGTVAFLVSEDAGYITGHTVSVNGGLFPT